MKVSILRFGMMMDVDAVFAWRLWTVSDQSAEG
jgi:hypothetical protein